MKTQLTLQQMAAELERQRIAKKDFLIDTAQAAMDTEGQLNFGGNVMPLNEIAHSQVAANLEIPASYYNRMKAETPELLSRNVNHWFKAEKKTRMVRTLDGVGRAFLSNSYQCIDNDEIAQTIPPILSARGTGEVDIESCAITETRMYIKAVFPKIQGEVKKGDVVQYGLAISNSEVGMGSVKIEPLVYRLVCKNGLIIPDASLNARHIGRRTSISDGVYELLSDEAKKADDNAILLKVRDIVAASFDEVRFERHLSMMRGAAQEKIEAHPEEAVKVLTKAKSLTEFESGSVLRHLIDGGDLSRWGLLNAVTRTAQDVESYDRATELETMGGNILTMPHAEWNRFNAAARKAA